MAKQLLGKEVTAALNERIKANVAELQGKGVNPTLCIIQVVLRPQVTRRAPASRNFHFLAKDSQIGRASCRERV